MKANMRPEMAVALEGQQHAWVSERKKKITDDVNCPLGLVQAHVQLLLGRFSLGCQVAKSDTDWFTMNWYRHDTVSTLKATEMCTQLCLEQNQIKEITSENEDWI